MPRNARKKSKSKIRSQNDKGQRIAAVEEKDKEKKEVKEAVFCNKKPENLLLVKDYVKVIQQRTLLEVAILCLLFEFDANQETAMSNWKISDLSKSLFSFLMGGGGSANGSNGSTSRQNNPNHSSPVHGVTFCIFFLLFSQNFF